MKSTAVFLIALFLIPPAFGQILFGQPAKSPAPYYRSGIIGIAINQDQDLRHSLFSYKPLRLNQEQVISMYQEDGLQDIIYYVDGEGVTQYISHGATSPANMNQLFTTKRDSFNPYGVKNPLEGVITGVLTTLFHRRFDLFRPKDERK